ncbi:MAG: hypothetical protein JSS30_03905 [Verrucomicrobia bacterium]|nr:hypothetical protein [Verrucomicrobiota bacterium]
MNGVNPSKMLVHHEVPNEATSKMIREDQYLAPNEAWKKPFIQTQDPITAKVVQAALCKGPFVAEPLKIEDVRTRLSNLVCEKIQMICSDNKRRLEGFKTDVSLLSSGIFYPQEYFHALQQVGEHAQINELREGDAFFNGYASTEHFDIDLKPSSASGKRSYSFTLKEGALPSEALQKMVEGLSLIDCLAVCHLVQYLAIHALIGTEKFNRLFAAGSTTPLKIGSLRPENPLYRLVTELNDVNPSYSKIEVGDLVYFKNNDSYLLKHMRGTAQGFNTFCISDQWNGQRYASLGFVPEGLSEKKVVRVLIEEFNLEPDNLEYLSTKTKEAFYKSLGERLKMAEKNRNHQINPQECNRLWNWQFALISRLDAEKITALANCTLEEALVLWDQYAP